MKYADVILPLPLENSYTYRIPEDLERAVTPGCRVIVHFGKKRYYTAIVMEVHDREPVSDFETKEIYALLDATPVLRRPQLRFWKWISSYYICKLGDVYKAALPSGLKLESETAVTYNEDFEATAPLRPNEQAVLDAFSGVLKLTISELEKKTGLRNVVPIVSSLMVKGAVEVSEELKRGFVPKTQAFIRLAEAYRDETKLQAVFEDLKRAKKQELLLVSFLDLSHTLNPALSKELSKKELLERSGYTSAVLEGLLKRGILESYEKEVGRLQVSVCRLQEPNPLSPAQEKAYGEIHEAFKTKEVCLLHGVTSSGKTEIYVRLIHEVLRLGRQVLYMLPEIAITTQITERLAKLFGDKLLVYHSKFSDNERVEVWNKLLHNDEPMLVLGVRSSLFLPFKDLCLIIVLKANYPSAFYTVALQWADDKEIPSLMAEMERCSPAKIVPPDINRSGTEFFTDYATDEIFWSLTRIKQVGLRTVEYIVTERDRGGAYTGIENFIHRIFRYKLKKYSYWDDPDNAEEAVKVPVNARHVKHMILAGCFDRIEKVGAVTERCALLERAARELGFSLSEKDFPQDMRGRHFFWSQQQIAVSGIGSIDYRRIFDNSEASGQVKGKASYLTLDEVARDENDGRRAAVCATVVDVAEHTYKDRETGSRKRFARLTLSQNNRLAECVCWNDYYMEHRTEIQSLKDRVVILTAVIRYSDYNGCNTLQTYKNSLLFIQS